MSALCHVASQRAPSKRSCEALPIGIYYLYVPLLQGCTCYSSIFLNLAKHALDLRLISVCLLRGHARASGMSEVCDDKSGAHLADIIINSTRTNGSDDCGVGLGPQKRDPTM